jgi:long-chain acyl-CoA synthetase
MGESSALASKERGAQERIIMTGATGFLGWQVFLCLYRECKDARFCLPVRGRRGQEADKRVAALVAHSFPPQERKEVLERIEVVPADLAQEKLGLSADAYERHARESTRIIHVAAEVHFDASLAELRRINVDGTRKVLEWAQLAHRAGDMRSFTHVSTAFVAGKRGGIVREDELEAGQEFRNAYELSKFEAEKLVKGAADQLPTIVVRPSIIVGDSQSGVTTSFKTLYWPLRVYANKRWRLVPGFPDAIVDMVPVDFVAEAIAHLSFQQRAIGRTVHLCAGFERSASVGQIAKSAADYFGVAPPRFVNPVLFLALLKPLLLAVIWGQRRKVLRTGKVYRPYFSTRTIFDTTVARELLGPLGIDPPRVEQYMENLFRYCRESDWGRRPVRLEELDDSPRAKAGIG